ncbi:hypothetical protein B5F40_02910 [Gordonibacter sp. An230]|uniref:alpha/beta fold hydrolase n=1 Tax=Gordonibacter sp. An230 TaxID=1965592 RepID=UPI000B3AE923|nr:alpha/beta hydrolase [Gordonibacter sp. An230]OUO91798.1 hypothetical protein B5F40_02910 [Gordonibacter sp. An230]
MRKEFTPEYAPVQGIEHFLLHGPEHRGAPVLLLLHGGPGYPERFFALQLERAWRGMFTQVHWDQRGAGLTLSRNGSDAHPRSIDQMVDDLHGIVEHLKLSYEVPKVVLLGHSWGSVLGSLYALRHPENLTAYLGSGQVVCLRENERKGFEQTKRLAKAANDRKGLALLEQVGDYPPADVDELLRALPKVRKAQGKYEKGPGIGALVAKTLADRVFTLRDLGSLVRASGANAILLREVVDFDLRAHGGRYACPVHYLLGMNDPITPTDLASAYFDELRAQRKTLSIIPDAGHSPMFEQPEAYAAALEAVRAEL